MSIKKFFGPSTLVTAAFIGPGTLTTCTMAGVNASYSLLWALLFSVVATIVLQEMAARLGFTTQQGLGEAINKQFSSGIARYIVLFLVVGAILVGNAAYEAGNISGGILGMELIVGETSFWPIVMGGIAFLLLFFGKYKLIEKFLITLVIVMSVCFLITAILVKPDIGAIFQGFIPSSLTDKELLTVLALIGTTVVPYNLFLHASTISKKYKKENALQDIRIENFTSIFLGGLISVLIIITAAATQGQLNDVTSAKDLALQLEPLFGNNAKLLMGIGLLSAGLSSTLTAPIAAAYAAKGLFNWSDDESDIKFRMTWIVVLGIGVFVAMTGLKPISIIKFAQIANAILLPFIAIYLIYLCNSEKIMGRFTNGIISNVIGIFVLLITFLISFRSINNFFGWLS